jgi:ribose transport system ATP-binding protein
MNTTNPYLSVENVSKQFPGTLALDEINFDLQKGEVHAIVGENGAGKSTLMKILSGAYTKTSGRILIDGDEAEIGNVDDSQRYGINMIYQELTNLPKLSVAENIFLGVLPRKSVLGLVDFNTLYGNAQEVLENYKLEISAKEQLSKLTVAEKQFVEIIRVISSKDARIIIMDEPTSSLTTDEIERLFAIISELKKREITVIYISHRLDEVVKIADRVSVFRDGKNRGTMERGQFDEEKIITLMLGHSLERREKTTITRSELIFEVKNLNIGGKINNFHMKLHKGEILGIAGLMGSGKDILVKSLFGLWPAQTKEVYYKGEEVQIRNPADALDKSIVYLPEERKTASLFLELSVEYNISPIYLFNIYGKVFLNKKVETDLAKSLIEKLNIKTPNAAEEIINLSGGNQQKAVFARLLALEPELMILNDPTRGIDVGSKEEIYSEIRTLASQGTSIILVSSEIEEVSYLANRVIVLSKGEICGEFVDDGVTLKNILTSAVRVAG